MPGTDTTGGVGPARTPPPRPPPLVTKKVTIFGHKKRDPQPAVLGSPLPVHVHGGGGGGEFCNRRYTTHLTRTVRCVWTISNVIQGHSMSFTVITHSDKIVLLAAAMTT